MPYSVIYEKRLLWILTILILCVDSSTIFYLSNIIQKTVIFSSMYYYQRFFLLMTYRVNCIVFYWVDFSSLCFVVAFCFVDAISIYFFIDRYFASSSEFLICFSCLSFFDPFFAKSNFIFQFFFDFFFSTGALFFRAKNSQSFFLFFLTKTAVSKKVFFKSQMNFFDSNLKSTNFFFNQCESFVKNLIIIFSKKKSGLSFAIIIFRETRKFLMICFFRLYFWRLFNGLRDEIFFQKKRMSF